ncbi:peroxidase-related enzyme [Anthocerotibacter panamensis]|uniref:peroxidase-related enzyme n=1 Tax=Anthocerotibacter panamensis TaxID=2857077 RepID=UPI001C407A8C|nr:peroxidase-related enzyme [Anthocerotibacter panamensis]
MAYIEMVQEAAAAGPLAALYRRFGNPDGTVDNVLKVHSLNPKSLEAHCSLYVQSMHLPSPVTRAEREMVGVLVSRLNGCHYCLEHHAAGLERLLPAERQEVVARLRQGELGGLTPRERAILRYAEKLTVTPDQMTHEDVAQLRQTGLSDREVLDIAQSAAYFAYANRIALGLGAQLEDPGALGQWPQV